MVGECQIFGRAKTMNILVMQGSPNVNGSTAMLANGFARGAREAGHVVDVADVTVLDIAPCTGCVTCGYGGPSIDEHGIVGKRPAQLYVERADLAGEALAAIEPPKA